VVAIGGLAACDERARDQIPDAPDAPDEPDAAVRWVVCAREGTSSVTGTGPAGSLAQSHVYVHALSGFCPDMLALIVTPEDPLATPYLDDSGVIYAEVGPGTISGQSEWSGTFPARISRSDETMNGSGTLQVDQATPGFRGPTRIRATVRFDEGSWHFTATIDAPYCVVSTCF